MDLGHGFLDFDPAYEQRSPVYLDIPNLYSRRRSAPSKKVKV